MDKRFDLPRARVNGCIHDVRARTRRTSSEETWLRNHGYFEGNHTKCGLTFRHATLPDTYLTNCMECLSMTEVDALKLEVTQLKEDHVSACALVADMHKAAVGSAKGPTLGVVEDVAAVRTAMLTSHARTVQLEGELEEARLEIQRLRDICLSA